MRSIRERRLRPRASATLRAVRGAPINPLCRSNPAEAPSPHAPEAPERRNQRRECGEHRVHRRFVAPPQRDFDAGAPQMRPCMAERVVVAQVVGLRKERECLIVAASSQRSPRFAQTLAALVPSPALLFGTPRVLSGHSVPLTPLVGSYSIESRAAGNHARSLRAGLIIEPGIR